MRYHYSKIVRESLFDDVYYENMLVESLNEGFNINEVKKFVSKIKDKKHSGQNLLKKFNKSANSNTKKIIGAALILIVLGNFVTKNNKWASSNEFHKQVEKYAIELAEHSEITTENIKTVANKIIEIEEVTITEKRHVFSLNSKGLIEEVNEVVPGRLSAEKIKQYDKYDAAIVAACKNLKAKGETPDANIIKGMMLIETGMNPTKNHLGFEGFPQTKKHIINGWTDKKGTFHPGINQKYKTNFTIEDMYDAEKSAEFIYYYMKGLEKSKYVNTLEDAVIAYNWGTGNLGKYKNGKEKLPNESKKYVAMMKVLQKYFS